MSDPAESIIPKEDLETFFRERRVSRRCEVCGTEDWIDLMAHVATIDAPPVGTPFNIASDQRVTGLLSVCHNCGNTKFFSRAILDMWKEARTADETREGV